MSIKYKKINWLNVILSSILYSDNSKKKLLNSKNELYLFLNNNFKLTITEYKKIIKSFMNYYLFLPKFIKDLDMSYITLDYYNNNYYVNISENNNYNEFDKYKIIPIVGLSLTFGYISIPAFLATMYIQK